MVAQKLESFIKTSRTMDTLEQMKDPELIKARKLFCESCPKYCDHLTEEVVTHV